MPTTYTPFTISVKNGNLSVNDYIKVTNYTSGGTITGKCKSNGECVLNPANSELNWSNGDEIMIESNGRYVFSKKTKLAQGGAKVTDTTGSADDNVQVNL